MSRTILFIFLFLLFVVGVCIVGESQVNEVEEDNELIESYANASKVTYNPLTKTYSFGKYINISEEELKLH